MTANSKIAGFRPHSDRTDRAEFILTCNNPRGGEWRCETEIECVTRNMKGDQSSMKRMEFNNAAPVRALDYWLWTSLVDDDRGFIINDKIVVIYRVKIISSEIHDDVKPTSNLHLSKFASPNDLNNITLVIGDKKIKVLKDYLEIISPVFSAMLFGNVAEKGKDEVDIKDVVYEEFLDLLHVIYIGVLPITDHNVLHILMLGQRFQIQGVMAQTEMHLIHSTGFKNKMGISDRYRLITLRDHCLNSIVTTQELSELCKSPEYTQFSENMKAAICDRFAQL